jgi:hypothetical protein
MASAPNPLGVLFPLTFTQNENAVDPRGLRAVLFSGTGWVWGTPLESTPSPRPRRAQLWHHRASLCGAIRQSPNRPIARRIRRRRERPEPLQRVRLFRFGVGGVRRPSPRPVCRAGGRRCTLPRPMADRTRSPSCSCAAPTGPSRTTSTGNAELRRTADRTAQPRACRRTPKQSAEDWGSSRSTRRRRGQVHSARRLPTRQPPASRAIPPRASCSDGCAVGAHCRRSPNQWGVRQPPTQHFTVTGALAARVPYCTRGSKCRARRARAAAAIGSAKRALARSTVPRTARGQARSARKRTFCATQCEFAVPPTQPD